MVTKYVARDGTGDYNCDGVDDQIQINQALAWAASTGTAGALATVHLKAGTYTISSSCLIGNYTILTGASTAIIKLKDNAGWAQYLGLIMKKDSGGNHHITFSGFEIDGNMANQPGVNNGSRYYPAIWLDGGCYEITADHMYIHDCLYDALFVRYNNSYNVSAPGNIIFTNNTIYKACHNALTCYGVNGIDYHDNDVYIWTNAALAIANSDHVEVYNNDIHSSFSGNSTGPGIEFDITHNTNVDDFNIHDNVFHDLNGAGIWAGCGPAADGGGLTGGLHIHHNLFYNVGQYWNDTGYSNAGIIIGQYQDYLIENNVFDNTGYSAIQTYSGNALTGSTTVKLNVYVQNNIIMNHTKGDAVGINNADHPSQYNFIVRYNCFYNNTNGNTIGTVTATGNITTNPLVYDAANRDYHLKSLYGRWNGTSWVKDTVQSPCIDAGYPSSVYSAEPEDNGNRIDIGMYGNTAYSSKSSACGGGVAPVANFTVSATTGEAPFSVTFTDSSTNTPTSWAWAFGDGSTSTTQSPVHSYSIAGNYTVSLTATNAYGSNTVTKNYLITVLETTPLTDLRRGVYCNQDFAGTHDGDYWSTAAKNIGGMGSVVSVVVAQEASSGYCRLCFPGATANYINHATTDEAASILDALKANDQKVILSIMPNLADVATVIDQVLNQYSDTYSDIILGVEVDLFYKRTGTVSLKMNDTERDAYLVVINGYNTDYMLFVTTPDDYTYCPSDSSDIVVLYNPFQNTQENILSGYTTLAGHFTNVGLYTGYLSDTPRVATDAQILAAAANTKFILHVEYDVWQYPYSVANFTASQRTGVNPLTVSFTDSSYNTPTSWAWSFGDGSTSTDQNPTHTYANAGVYTVSLTATNANGADVQTKSNYITVTEETGVLMHTINYMRSRARY